jgi:hypothetical protein
MKLCEDCTAGEVMDDGCTRCVCMLARGGGLTWGCSLNVCECTPGEQRLADDGCNTCTCAENGTWQCTEIGCMACVEGEMRDAGDGCNTCTCDASGSFICTRLYCPVTCEPDSADCDGVRENGCEADLQNSVENCGQCGYYCAHAGASSVCKAGGCFLDRCMDGYEDCNGDPNDGCEAPVGEGGCEDRCEVPNDAPAPSPSDESCNCPEGTACVLGSVENEGRPYCFPLPETCPGYGTCACLGFCVCPADPGAYCYESMAPGGKMDVHCSRSD